MSENIIILKREKGRYRLGDNLQLKERSDIADHLNDPTTICLLAACTDWVRVSAVRS